MLSLTYTLTALKVEQDRVRAHLHAFRKILAEDFTDSDPCSRIVLEQLLHQLKRVHLNCSWRRLEVHVIPEIKGITESMDLLLAELDALRLLGLDLYRSARDRLRMGIEGGQADKQELSRIMRMYCSTLQEMLAKEEHRLFNEAFAAVAEEKWFSIAQCFMQLDKKTLEREEMGEVKSRQQGHPHVSSMSKPDMESPLFGASRPDPDAQVATQTCARNQLFPRLASQKVKNSAQSACSER